MKIYEYVNLFFVKYEIFQTKVVAKIKTYVLW
jgi:hypothetical protein